MATPPMRDSNHKETDVVLLLSASPKDGGLRSSMREDQVIAVSDVPIGDESLHDEQGEMANAIAQLRKIELQLAIREEELQRREAALVAVEAQRQRAFGQKMLSLAARERRVMELEAKLQLEQLQLGGKVESTHGEEGRRKKLSQYSWTERMKAASAFVAGSATASVQAHE